MQPGDTASLTAYVQQKAPAYGLDPAAVLAVASVEGASGAVGDNGSSYGPWQLHKGGAYPASAPQDPQAANAWAWSPAGVDYALRRMSAVAAGLRGRNAVVAIVTRFERPSKPQAEVASAWANYGKPLGKSGGGGGGGVWRDVTGVVDVATNPIGSAVGAATGLVGGASSVGSFFGEVSSASFWLRALELVGGGLMLLVGLYLLARRVGLAPAPSTIAAVTPVGRAALEAGA